MFFCSVGILGLIIGSFLNVVIHRLPIMMERDSLAFCSELLNTPQGPPEEAFNLVVPRSRCPKCGHGITALENVPVISWLLLRGRCSGCRVKIPIRYPAVEIFTGILSVAVAWHFGVSWQTVAALLFTWALIALTFIDFDEQLLPDSITLPVLWAGLFVNLFGLFATLTESVIGAMAGFLSLWSIYHLFRLLTGKKGMGYGDFKLLALIGAWLGWQNLPATIFVASVLGAVVGLSLIAFRRHDKNIPIPFGPYLAGAGLISMLWGADLTRWYLS